MIDEKLYSDLVDLYERNVKAFKEQNSGLIIETVYPLEISALEEAIKTKELVDHQYIKKHFLNFTISPSPCELDNRNGVYRVTIKPDICWEKQYDD